MKHLTILVDMDDTIESLASAWVDYLNARHGTTTKLTDITGWDISKAFPTLTNEQVYAPLFEDDFWDCVKPIDGASGLDCNHIELPYARIKNGTGVIQILPVPNVERCHYHFPQAACEW